MSVVRNSPRVLARTRAFEKSCFRRISAKLYTLASGIRRKLECGGARLCQNQDLQDWRDLQDFAFARLNLFAITGNPAKTNMDERLPVKDARTGES